MEFSDKVVLITGAGQVLGRAIAEAFATFGAIVAANDLTPINLDETVARIQSSGGRVKDYIFDIARKMPVQAMIEQVVQDWGHIDVLINNARAAPHVSVLSMDEWDWHRTIDVNLGGPFFTMQSVGRVMQVQGGGVMLNVIAGFQREEDWMGRPAFVASQVGLAGLTQAAARELEGDHIRVNAICPEMSQLDSLPITVGSIPVKDTHEQSDYLKAVVQVVLYLCSQAATHLNGQILKVDEGLRMSQSTPFLY